MLYLTIRRFFCGVVLIIAGIFPLTGQQQTQVFHWLDTNEKLHNGLLKVELIEQTNRVVFQVKFTVTWFDLNSQPLKHQDQKPYLYLSKYGLFLSPPETCKCLTFEGTNQVELVFQDEGQLLISSANTKMDTLVLKTEMHYALSYSDYQKGKLEPVRSDSGSTFSFSFPLYPPEPDTKIQRTDIIAKQNIPPLLNPAIKEQSEQMIQRLEIRKAQLNRWTLPPEVISWGSELDSVPVITNQRQADSLSPLVNDALFSLQLQIQEIDQFIGEVEMSRQRLNKDSLDDVDYTSFEERLNKLWDESGQERAKYYQFQLTLLKVQKEINSHKGLHYTDSLLQVAKARFIPLFRKHIDSLKRLDNIYQVVAADLLPFFTGPRTKWQNNPALDSISGLHERIHMLMDQLKAEHDQEWTNYRSFLVGIGRVNEVEQLHADFNENYYRINLLVKENTKKISELRIPLESPGWLKSGIPIWIGSGVILLLLVILIVRYQLRAGKHARDTVTQALGPFAIKSGNNGGQGHYALDPVAYENYYEISFAQRMPDVVIDKIHFHNSVIKSIYQIVHGILMKKTPSEFGGFLFGNQYRLRSNGHIKYELLVEKVVPALSIRFDNVDTATHGADLVDELDEAVRQNKKLLLLGWYASSIDATLEMEPQFQKIHRTFFSEKWQIALLMNPGTANLQSALFMRRKSGFFESFPEPGALLNWDELYTHVMHPRVHTPEKDPFSDLQLKKALKIPLHSDWCDSIIETLWFLPDILPSIIKDNEMQFEPGVSYRVTGFLYGSVREFSPPAARRKGYEVIVTRFVEAVNGGSPREIPGYHLLGWWGQGAREIQDFLNAALTYHEPLFTAPYHFFCLSNSQNGELRIFSRNHQMSLNRNLIDTEELNTNTLLKDSQ
ncbi:MAG: hypothetical protein J7L89_06020 [Bacteroidales bacterium]|nr:hypothetical protein [Bacteroidales bacterium]